MKILVVDNYDSFTFNLVQLVTAHGGTAIVRRNDAVTLAEVAALRPNRIVLSPGPGRPDDPRRVGVCLNLVRSATVPVLGVCLGHQAIAVAFGGAVVRAPRPMHGKASAVVHDGSAPFAGVASPFTAMRYHSLVVDEEALPACLRVVARSADDGCVMAIAHRERPILGVQFHPESIGTPAGSRLFATFLSEEAPARRAAGAAGQAPLPT